ncbi:SDR family NAD(P)-dependent oxidoreductase, partial [Nonomuraea wenchangensis]
LDRCDVLVNNAGGAFGLEPVAEGRLADWQRMYDVNVLGSLRMTQALTPKLIDSGDGVLVMLTSTAGLVSYEGGGGYCAAKHAQSSMAETLRLELVGQPVRVVEIAPGMVRSEGFAVTRFRGDQEAADRVYEGVPDPLSSDDVADAIAWCVTRPAHVNIDRLVIRPRAQAAQHKVHRVR